MSSSVLNFPNSATQWRKGASPNPGGKPKGGRVVQRKARELRKAAAVAEILNADKPRFAGDGVDLLIETYKDPTMPLEVRLACATQAAQYERSKRLPASPDPLPVEVDFKWADASPVQSREPGALLGYDQMTNEELDAEIARLQALRRAEAPADG